MTVDSIIPRSYYPATWDWVRSSKLKKGLKGEFYFEFCNPQKVYRLHPKSLEQPIHWKFRVELQHEFPAAFVAVVPDGRILGANGAVLTSDNIAITDAYIEFNKAPEEYAIFKQQNFPAANYTKEAVAILATQASENYFHWMFDLLPRFYLLDLSGLKIDKYAIRLTNSCNFQTETLDWLSIPKDKLLTCDKQFNLKCEKLVVPSLPGKPGHMPKWACTFLREKFLNQRRSLLGYDRIYISRQYPGRGRQVVNENEVIDYLSTLGFKSLLLDSMPLSDQISLFSSANAIVSPHGAGLTNLVFCNPGTKVIEFFSPNYVNVCYWGLCNNVNLDYYYFLGEGTRPTEYEDPHDIYSNIHVNLDVLKAIMKYAGFE